MPENCHSREGGNPGIHWMPDQVRHDGVSLFNVRVNIKLDSLDLFPDELRAYASSAQVKKPEGNGVNTK